MASNMPCAGCLRQLRRQVRGVSQSPNAFIRHPATRRSLYMTSKYQASDSQINKPSSATPIPSPGTGPPSRTSIPKPSSALIDGPAVRAAKELRKRAARTTETYVAYGATERLYKTCAQQADYSVTQVKQGGAMVPKTATGVDLGDSDSWWYRELGLTPTFNTWAQITMLHVYLLATRIRCFPAEHAPAWQQHLVNHFFYDAEDRMAKYHGIDSGGMRSRYLKDLFVQYRGAMAAYDEGLCRGDAVLGTALWRNVFAADDEADLEGVGTVVAYVRRALKTLDQMPDEDVAAGEVVFGDPAKEGAVVRRKSKAMAEPFTEEDLKGKDVGEAS